MSDSDSLGNRLRDALEGSRLAAKLDTLAAPFLERRSEDAASRRLEGKTLRGLARVLASQAQIAGFLSHRPELLERIADADESTLAERAKELEGSDDNGVEDLENALDALRILRHEETCLAACLDLGGIARFESVSHFLSILAETIARRALSLAQAQLSSAGTVTEFAVLGMGKIAGRELTYHSDLDLIFLQTGSVEEVYSASRVAQRMISYLGTMTGAGVAYAVDTRLRPSGGQGVLVTTFDGFERYQLDRAESWEHIALLRARAIAGHSDAAQRVLDRVRDRVMNDSGECWEYIADLRARVELERAMTSSKAISVKTGRGGLMDVDFLAAGGVLETGGAGFPRLPSVPAMLHSLGRGAQIDQLLADYGFLRQIESRARWIAGRATDEARIDQDGLALLADLSNLDLEPEPLLDELTAVRERIRAAFDSVVRARSIAAVTS